MFVAIEATPMTQELSFNWNINTLNKAYQQGYMAGVLGMEAGKCPYRGEVVIAAWEAGWEDGLASHQEQQKQLRERIA